MRFKNSTYSILAHFRGTSYGMKRLLILLYITGCPVMIYTSLYHQRGVISVTGYLYNAARQSKTVEIWFLTPCHSTPFYSHVHFNVSMRFLTCEPNLRKLENYIDEADQFYLNPLNWLNNEFAINPAKSPSHIVLFENLWMQFRGWFSSYGYGKCANFFNTHFPISSRQSSYLLILCKDKHNRYLT